MARKPNYGLNKHRKEQDRKAKKDAKLAERQRRREEEAQGPEATTDATGAPTESTPSNPGS